VAGRGDPRTRRRRHRRLRAAGFGRPDFFLKVREGRGESVRRCFFTNYCEALDQAHKEVTCQRWDREGLGAPDLQLSRDQKRRLIAP
jgi:hypothetical protein